MRLLVFLLAASLPGIAGAQSSIELLKCSSISDSVKRLECFDELTLKGQIEVNDNASEELGSPKSTNSWSVQIEQSPVDDSKTVILRAKAKESVAGRFNRDANPSLILRCLRNTTSAYINFDGLHMADIQGYGKITFRVDKKKAFSRNTSVSTDSKALGFWNGGSSIPFIKQLFGGETLLVQATPFSDSPVTFSMNISGIEEAITPLRKTCNW